MHRLLVCFGNAESGRLGLGAGTLSAVLLPRVCLALARYDLESVAAGGAHTAVVTRGGLLFTFGLNSRGQLGHSAGSDSAAEPGNVLLQEPVTAVAAGDAHTLCLTESGRVYAFGCNEAGQLGVGPKAMGGESSTARPTLVEALTGQRVVSVAAGSAHSLAVTEAGRLYAWGTGGSGRLGLGRCGGASSGTSSSGGENHCTISGSTSDSSNNRGNTGSGSSSDSSGSSDSGHGSGCGGGDRYHAWSELLPRHVDCAALRGVRVAAAFAGPATSACTDDAGRVYTWGYGGLHQLGHGGGGGGSGGGSAGEDEWEPRLVDVPSLRRTRRLSMGAAHALACREDERVHVWGTDRSGVGCMGMGPLGPGYGSFGMAAPEKGSGRVVPRPTIFKLWFTDVAAGLAHSAGISSDGRLYTWGWGGSLAGAGNLQLPRLGAPGSEGFAPGGGSAEARLRLGGGQLGVGAGVDLPSPTLVTKLEILPGEVFRQDGGDPFNYQDSNLGWLFRQVACGHNHTVALIQVAGGWTQAVKSGGRERRPPLLPGGP